MELKPGYIYCNTGRKFFMAPDVDYMSDFNHMKPIENGDMFLVTAVINNEYEEPTYELLVNGSIGYVIAVFFGDRRRSSVAWVC